MKRLYHPARDDISLANVLNALSDPVRLRLLLCLAETTEAACHTFDVGVAKSTLSHHLKLLREAGVTRTRIEGIRNLVSLRREDLDARFPGLISTLLDAARRDETLQTPSATETLRG